MTTNVFYRHQKTDAHHTHFNTFKLSCPTPQIYVFVVLSPGAIPIKLPGFVYKVYVIKQNM